MRVTSTGLNMIRKHEGLRLRAYRDAVGELTNGYGHTGPDVREGQEITLQQAEQLLAADVLEAEQTIVRMLPAEIVCQIRAPAWDALVSFVFNVGSQAFKNRDGSRTGLYRALIERRWHDVPAEMRRWVYAGGKVLPGLRKRREEEAALWSSAWPVADDSEPGVVPEPAPAPKPLALTKTVGGAAVSVTAGAVAVGEQVQQAAQSASMLSQPGTWLAVICVLGVFVGAGLTIYGRWDARKRGGV